MTRKLRHRNSHAVAGRIYWSAKQVRVWTNGGKVLDLGPRSVESAKRVAAELGYDFIHTEEVTTV